METVRGYGRRQTKEDASRVGWVHDRPTGLARAPDVGCEGEGWRGTPQVERVPEGPKVWGRGARIPSFFSFNDFQSQVKIGEEYRENLAPKSNEAEDVRDSGRFCPLAACASHFGNASASRAPSHAGTGLCVSFCLVHKDHPLEQEDHKQP